MKLMKPKYLKTIKNKVKKEYPLWKLTAAKLN